MMADRVILHSDINCCYASIEHLYHPELAGKPLAVGGDPEARHGIVLTADYTAKKYGVKTGMALWQAKEVCPDITFVSPRMDLYLRFSRMAHEIYAEYTDMQEPYGIDECWLDVTGSSSLKGDGLLIAQEISRRMKSELGITVSVGVSFNKIFAKLGSDYKKPDAITTMYKSEFKQKAWSLPVADLLYVGKSTNRKLALFGIKTIGDLARADEEVLNSHLGKMGSILWSFANGYDDSPVKLENTHAPIKSVGNSTTTPKDLVCDEDVKIVLYILAESVAARLRENGFRCRVVEISVRDNELFSFTRQKKIDHATNITGEIAAYAYQIFKENYNWSKPIRINALVASDMVLIPVQAAYLPVKGLQQLIRTISMVKKRLNRKLTIQGILLTMVDFRTNYAKDIASRVKETYGSKIAIFENVIPLSVKVAEASAEGKSIYCHCPNGKVSMAYENLTQEVLENEK